MYFEPGDKVKDKRSGVTYEVLAAHELSDCVWIVPCGPSSYLARTPRTMYSASHALEKYAPFFEAGKTYRPAVGSTSHNTPSARFKVVRVDTDGSGQRVAYGSYSDDTSSGDVWATRRNGYGTMWVEVE